MIALRSETSKAVDSERTSLSDVFESEQMEHESYELKWAGEKDAEAYKKKLEQERRDSFKFRNEERVRHAKVMEELKSIAREQETESLMLKWAGEEDAKAYLAQLEEERRQSFKLRNKEGRRHRELDEEAHHQAVQEAHNDEMLQAACKSLGLSICHAVHFRISHHSSYSLLLLL